MTENQIKDQIIKKKKRIERENEKHKRLINFGEQVLLKLSYQPQIEDFTFYLYAQIIELLKNNLKINVNETLLKQIINGIIKEKTQVWIKKISGIYFEF